MKIREIRELSTKELNERLAQSRENLSRLKLGHAISPLDNPSEIKKTRRTVAKLTAELGLRESKGVQ